MPEAAVAVPAAVVEAAAFATGLATALRRAGVPVPPDRVASFAAALRLSPPASRSPLYWSARVTLPAEQTQLATFDAVFSALFDGQLDPADSRGEKNAPPPVGSEPRTRPAAPGGRPVDGLPGGAPSAPTPGSCDPPDTKVPLAVASGAERLQESSFADLSDDEVAEVRRLVRRLVLSTPVQRTRRTTPSNRSGDRLDLRRTLRGAQRSGQDPVRLVHRRRRDRPRRLVLLCDVSGSMTPYTRVFLSLLQGAVAGAKAEAFVFSTRLTRLTRQLKGRDPDLALARAAAAAPDLAGGTRLADSLRVFLDEHARRGLGRRAVVVVLSDGWAHDDPDEVAGQMARLKRLAHSVIWVNPRAAGREFVPLVGGMAAALPYCDAFVSGHSVAALDQVVAAIRAPRNQKRNPS